MRKELAAVAAILVGACHAPTRPPAVPQPTQGEESPARGRFARLILATWTEEQQHQLTAAARGGLAVFAASGTNVRLLPGCQMDGRYQYLGVNPQRQHVALADDAQVRINLALGPDALPPRSPLTLDLLHIGTLATTRRSGEGAVLAGACAGATHFARTLSVGETGPVAERVDSRTGCAAASTNDIGPPKQCHRFLGVELVGLRDATFDTADGGITFCPSGWALADDICLPRAAAAIHECADEPADCRAQCDRGSAPSCTRLGYLLAHGERGFVRDDKQALTFYERACSAGYPPACFNIGVLHWSDTTVQKNEGLAEQYWRRACSAGYAAACSNLGVLHMQAGPRPVDRERAVYYFTRACAGGEPHGCLDAVRVIDGQQRTHFDGDVGALLTAACDGDVAAACLDLSIWLSQHGGTPEATKDLVSKACRLGARQACVLPSPTEKI